jgi:ATP-binding cassette, subfamily B, bacterial HlyB/CyaB
MDSGLHSLVAIARFHQLPAEPEQLSHEFKVPDTPLSDTKLLRQQKTDGILLSFL